MKTAPQPHRLATTKVAAPVDQFSGRLASELAHPMASARAAGLRYVSDGSAGIRRQRSGKGFTYVGRDAARVTDAQTLARIRSLAIPPAWTDVWICSVRNGHIQATGRDDKRRKQYRYHAQWAEVRDAVKYERLSEFGEGLPRIRQHVDEDLSRVGSPRETVLALIIRLLAETSIRIGNEEYVEQNKSYGLTTLRTRHVSVDGFTIRLKFRGKSGKEHDVRISDRRLARVIKGLQELPGQELFQYLDVNGERHTIDSDDVNEYLREISGGDFTAKDFRTWNGTLLAARFLSTCAPKESERHAKQEISAAIRRVAEQLRNTPAVCRKAYVHPVVIDAYQQGCLILRDEESVAQPPPYALSQEERALLNLLRPMARVAATTLQAGPSRAASA